MFNIKKILFPIDLDAKDFSPVIAALKVAELFGSAVHFLYVNDLDAGHHHPTDYEDAVALKVRETVPESLLDSLKITYAVAKGSLASEIVKYCTDEAFDLIIVGHKHRHRIYSALFDSPDEDIIDAVKLPVLVIPQK